MKKNEDSEKKRIQGPSFIEKGQEKSLIFKGKRLLKLRIRHRKILC